MGFFARHRKAFRSVIASFGMLFGLLAGCATNPVVEQEKEPENAQVMPFSNGALNLGIEGLSASYSGGGSFNYSNGALSGSLTGGSWGKTTTATLKITNQTGSDILFSFTVGEISIGKSVYPEGTITIWGISEPSAGQSFEKTLGTGQSFEIFLRARGSANTSKFTLSPFSAKQKILFTTIFKNPSPNAGVFSVDGTNVTGETTLSKYGTEFYLLKYVAVSGQTFVGWDINGELVSNAAEYSFSPTKNNQVVFPRVYVAGTAMFSVGGMTFDNLNQAITKAKSGSDKTIVAVKDGNVPAGNYTLDSGFSLLVPNENGTSLSEYATEDPKYVKNTATQCALFRKISFLSGANLNVYGQVVVCCTPAFKTVSSNEFNNHTAIPSGAYGQIEMQQGSTMVIQSGAKLYAWGFVTGEGLIEAKSGATIYELFQISSWRGGSVAKDMNKNKQKVFIINQYYVQNVECKLKIWAGGTEKTLTGMYMSLEGIEKVPHPCFTFIGNGGMFNLTQGYMTKKYEPSLDRLNIEISGNGQLSSIAFSLSITFLLIPINIELDAKDYVLPINNNISITIRTGSACYTNQDLGFLPGSELIVEQGASFEIQKGHNLTFYDLDNWGNYATERKLRPVLYSPTRTKTRTEADLTDAKLALDGTLTVGSGSYLMTTGKDTDTNIGARIVSPGRTGVIKFTDKSATTCPEVYQYYGKDSDVSKNYVLIDATLAKLQNGDHSYTQSTPGNTYTYDKVLDRWNLLANPPVKTGLFKTLDDNTIQTVLLHDDVKQSNYTGLFYYSKDTSASYNAADERYYYLNKGVVSKRNEWWKDSTNGAYYHFGPNQYAYQNVSVVLTPMASGDNPARGIKARHFFDPNAKLLRMVSVDSITSNFSSGMTITKGICYYNGIKAGFGLFENQSHVYLAKDDGTLMANGTYYVPSHKINNIKDSSGKVLTAGLYYFDENGHMYDSNFKEITRGNAS